MITNVKKTLEGINNVLARKLKNTKPITFIKDPNDNDSLTTQVEQPTLLMTISLLLAGT